MSAPFVSAANASRDQTTDYERIAKEILAEADAVDQAEDERWNPALRLTEMQLRLDCVSIRRERCANLRWQAWWRTEVAPVCEGLRRGLFDRAAQI